MTSKSSFLIKIEQRYYLIIIILCYLIMGWWGLVFGLIAYLNQIIVLRLISIRSGIICYASNYQLIYTRRGSFIVRKYLKYGAFVHYFLLRSAYGNEYSFFLLGYYPEFNLLIS
jgi:hypothetical protein